MSGDILSRFAEAFDAEDHDGLVSVYEYTDALPGLQTAINTLRKRYKRPSEYSMVAVLRELRGGKDETHTTY